MPLQITSLDDPKAFGTPSSWEILSSETVLRDEWISLRADTCMRGDRTIIERYYVFSARDWVNVLPICEDGIVTLVNEYRHGIGSVLLGLPGGLIDEDESSSQAARRELFEETGLSAKQMIKSGAMPANPSTHTNTGISYVAIMPPSAQLTAASQEADLRLVHLPLSKLVDLVFSSQSRLSGYDVASILRGLSVLTTLDCSECSRLRTAIRDSLLGWFRQRSNERTIR